MVRTGDGFPLWPLLGTIVFIVLLPGTAVGLFPYLLSGWVFQPPFFATTLTRWLGVALLVGGFPFFITFCARFVFEGRGTPAPVAPTERLVVGGPFRYTRNPGCLSVLAMIIGQGLILGNMQVLLYAVLVGIGFHVFVVFYEEPTLRGQFGAEYQAYCQRVPVWLPRRPR